MKVTFQNVTITVTADTEQEAYEKLIALLGDGRNIRFSTDTFTTSEVPERERDTAELV